MATILRVCCIIPLRDHAADHLISAVIANYAQDFIATAFIFIMKRRLILTLLFAALVCAEQAVSCSFVEGFFYQVTNLRGKVVGRDAKWPLLGYRSYPQWLRHRTVRADATLRLYEYSLPRSYRESRPIANTRTDKDGRFDFGQLHDGHYTLVIDWSEYSDIFDVEIKKLPVETSWILIDVSPVNPDCTGGHEFIISSK